MKILYLANECRAAELGLHGLHGIAPNVTLTWARTPRSALRWVHDNLDVAAIIVEPDLDGQSGTSFVEHLRGLGLATPVVVVLPERPAAPPAAVNAPAAALGDDQSAAAHLTHIVIRAVQRTRGAAAAGASPLTRDARICVALQQGLLDLEAALRDAEQRRVSEAAAAAEHLARREAELGAALAEAVAARTAAKHALGAAAAAHRHAEQCAAADRAAAAARQAALESRLAQEATTRTTLEQHLATVKTARLDADHWHATELEALGARLADVQAQHDAALTEHAAARAAFEQQLADAAAALEHARQERASEAAAAAERLARREAELHAAVAEAVAARIAAERAREEAAAAHQDAQQCAATGRAAAAERQAALESQLAQEATTRTTLEQHLAAAAAARLDADHRHAAERARLERRLADVEAQLGASLAEHAAVRAALEQQLADTAAALEGARQERASEAAAAAERVAELVDRLAQESAMRTTLARDLAENRVRSVQTRRRFLELARALRRRTREQRARLEAQLNAERADWARTLGARAEEIRRLQLERETLQHRLATIRQELHRLRTIDERLQGSERARVASESELRRLSAEYDRVRQSLDQVRAAFNTLERVASEHAVERARLEGVVADRDTQLSAGAGRHRAAEDALARVEEHHRLTLEGSNRDIARLQREIDALRQELEATRSQADGLRSDAERVPVLQTQLDLSLKENRRQFERAPYGLCQFTRDGTITHVNQSLVSLLGYQSPDELLRVDFAATVFESAGDLRWLIERSTSTGATESIETIWMTRDRRRLSVRLQALTIADGPVEMAVEDSTNLRAVERRLRRAQRLEAVGRLASEVAVTCDALLRDVVQGVQRWLAGIDADAAVRSEAEQLLREVTRAAAFLLQFAVYGKNQINAHEPVSVQRVLHDLEPVLKRVAGDDIELVLPTTTAPAVVDVDAERVERVLVNVASYARERMPHGGRVNIDLATTVIDRRFVAKYPNVRPGPHVVITVTEVRNAARPGFALQPQPEPAASDPSESASDKPGVDLGALLGLIGDCGGHLWMAAEPSGNMILQIHLPKLAADDADVTESAAPAARSDHGRQLAGRFRH
jgi:hypothetical protein